MIPERDNFLYMILWYFDWYDTIPCSPIFKQYWWPWVLVTMGLGI